jgi:hypothetical protein
LKKNIPQTLGRTDVFSQHAPRAWQEKSSGELGEKNQTNAGRVSQYTSPLQRNISLFSQAICGQASCRVFQVGSVACTCNTQEKDL